MNPTLSLLHNKINSASTSLKKGNPSLDDPQQTPAASYTVVHYHNDSGGCMAY